VDAIGLERPAKGCERMLDAAIHHERRRRLQKARDLRHGQLVVEPQPQDQTVGRRESRERASEERGALASQQAVVRRHGVSEHLQPHGVSDEVSQEASLGMSIAIARLKSAVPLPVMVDAKASHHDQKPRCELAMSVGDITPQAGMIVATKLIDHELVVAHDPVVVMAP